MTQEQASQRIKQLVEYVRLLQPDQSKESVGRLIGVSAATIFKWSKGYVEELSRDSQQRLATTLRCDLAHLQAYLAGELDWESFLSKTTLPSEDLSSLTDKFLKWLPFMSFTEVVLVWQKVQEVVYTKIQQNLPLLAGSPSFRDRPLFILLEAERIKSHLSIEEWSQQLQTSLKLSEIRAITITKGESILTDDELKNLSLRKSDNEYYSYEELKVLRDRRSEQFAALVSAPNFRESGTPENMPKNPGSI